MSQLEVPIMGQAYTLSCPEGTEQRMLEAVHRVDAAMCRIRDAGKIRARERIAVLAALNLAFDQIEKEQQRPTATTAATARAAADPAAAAEAALLHPRLEMMLQRVDQLLAADGRLL